MNDALNDLFICPFLTEKLLHDVFSKPRESRTGQTDPACDGHGCMESAFEKGLRNLGIEEATRLRAL